VTVATAPAGAKPTTETGRRSKLDPKSRAERRLAWMLCAPAVVVMAAVVVYPVCYAIYLSFRRYDLRYPADTKWVGFANYSAVLTSRYWWDALSYTVLIMVVSVALEFVLGFAIAILMRRALYLRNLFRTIVLIPYGIITVVSAFSWQFAWTPHLGWIAGLLPSSSAPLANHWQATGIVILSEVWKATPFMSLLLLAGLVLVPDDLMEAAAIDGATGWQRFRHIVLPIMKPAILVALLFRSLDAFRIFDQIYILTAGAHNTTPVSLLSFNQVFVGLNLGIGSAMSILIFVVTVIIALLFIKGFGAAAPGSERGAP
jgi:multiple sugar transport system permease protein